MVVQKVSCMRRVICWFVFSSRRRHTRLQGDWSSDVCSSDLDDRSFNAAAWVGVKCAETGLLPDGQPCGKPKLDIVLRDVEPGNPTSMEPAMRAFAERHYDLIIGVGFAQAPIMESVARDYPNINFAIVDGVSQLPNVASLVFREHEGSYLVG